MLKRLSLIASLVLPYSAFAADSENLPLPKRNELSITCMGESQVRSYRSSDIQGLILKRVTAGNAVKYELYLFDGLVFACDQVLVK